MSAMRKWTNRAGGWSQGHWRRAGTFVCLLALMMALFGHVELSPMATVGVEKAAATQLHGDHSSLQAGLDALDHCAQHASCNFHALLPVTISIAPVASAVGAPNLLAVGRALPISPQPQPPKFS